jgi:hypothetical protein
MSPRLQRVCGPRQLRRYLVFALLVTGGSLAVFAAALGRAAPTRHAIVFRISHFQCYAVDPTSRTRPRKVLLRDQFGAGTGVAYPLVGLCNPVRKNGSPVRNPRAHLACYRLTSTKPFTQRQVAVTNQLDRNARLVVTSPQRLCLPTGKSLRPTVFPPLPKGLDHFECYPVKPLKPLPPHSVKLADEFGSSAARTLRPSSLCNPVSKNRGTILNRRDHLVCYDLTSTKSTPRRLAITNQFGRATLVATRALTLCVPSLKKTLS